MNVSLNIQAIESVKSAILTETAELYNILANNDESELYSGAISKIASVIAMEYILARRLGISFAAVDSQILDLLTVAEESGHFLETEFSDMSELHKHLKKR